VTRVWPVLLHFAAALLLVLVGNVLLGFGIGFCLGFTRGVAGQSVEDVPEQAEAFASSPAGMLLFVLAGQASLALVLWLATLRQRGARRVWLGMLPARLCRSEFALLVLGALPVAWVGGHSGGPCGPALHAR
jgi:hypothetical protein